MKKTYIIPEMTTTDVVLEQMLAGSPGGVNDDGNVVVDPNPEGGDGSDAAVKGSYNVWDVEW